MSKSTSKILRQEYDRLKKAFEKMLKSRNERPLPQWALQPVRHHYPKNNQGSK
ncbi:MAG TPA: hypothetical protein VMZ03_06820 [Chitinophagaceae bacterium]|nr:hypothetical protein [Chitinophagaceae bacterium]